MRNPGRGDSGVALVFVLWVIVLLTVVAGGFSYSVHRSIRTSFYTGLETKAFYIAQAGIETAVTDFFEQKKSGKGKKWRINAKNPEVTFDDGEFSISISNQGGKINLNEANEDFLNLVLSRFELDAGQRQTIVSSILDWRDNDHLHRLNGAENDYYQSLPRPYRCRNGEFLSLNELLMVRGVTSDLYYGGLKELLCIDKNENLLLPKRSEIQEYLKLENREVANSIQTFLTLEKRDEMNRVGRKYNYSKININAASPLMLRSLPGMTGPLVDKIKTFRQTEDFKTLDEFKQLVGAEGYAKMEKYISVQESRYYTLSSTGRVSGSDVIQKIDLDIWLDNEKFTKYIVMQKRVNVYGFLGDNHLPAGSR